MSSDKARIEALRGRLKSTTTIAAVEDEEDDSPMGKSNSKSLIRGKNRL